MADHYDIPDKAVTVPDEVPLRDTVLRIALNAYAAGTGAQSWDALTHVIGPHDADVYKRAVTSTVEPFVSVLAAWRVERDDLREEVEELRELARTFAREVADIARALGFEGDNAEPDPVDILCRIEKVKVDALPVLNTAKPTRPRLVSGDIPITERTPHGVWIADGPDPDRFSPACGGLFDCDDCRAYHALRQHLVEQVMLLDQQRQDETAALRAELEQHRSGESYEIGENYGRTTQANSCVRDLLEAVYPGDPMPDRPLDTIWEHLLEQVRKMTSARSTFHCPGITMPQPAGAPAEGFVACYRAGHRCTSTTAETEDVYGGLDSRMFCPCCGDFQGSQSIPASLRGEQS